jgi:hypothetical protein
MDGCLPGAATSPVASYLVVGGFFCYYIVYEKKPRTKKNRARSLTLFS